jgi:hypothetical protein
MLHFKFSLFTSSAMASSSTHRVSDVPDANLLDEDDFEFELDQAECAALNAQTPRAGKKIRMNSPPPRSPASSSTGPESPSRTPPRDLGTSQNRTDKHETPASTQLVCKTNISIRTDDINVDQLIVKAEYKSDSSFHVFRSALENLIKRAEMTLMSEEPFHTLLYQGYTFNISQPQLSYKATDASGPFIHSVEINKLTSGRNKAPQPIIKHEGTRKAYASVDICFRFHIQPFSGTRKSKLVSQGTNTYDSVALNPIIDQIREHAPEMDNLKRNDQAGSTLMTSQIQVIHEQPAPKRPRSPSSQRPHDRLGPPVQHSFNRRQRSREGFRHRLPGPPAHSRGRRGRFS